SSDSLRILVTYYLYLYSPLTSFFFFFFNDTAPTEIYTLSLHDALPISMRFARIASASAASSTSSPRAVLTRTAVRFMRARRSARSEEHTSELQSPYDLVCRLLLEKKKKKKTRKLIKYNSRQTNVIDYLQ